jgi:hypothetical protein
MTMFFSERSKMMGAEDLAMKEEREDARRLVEAMKAIEQHITNTNDHSATFQAPRA